MDTQKLIDIGSKVSLAVVLMFVIWAGNSGYWVFGQTYRDALADRDVWKELALKGTNLAREATSPHAVGMGPPVPETREANPQQIAATLKQIETTVRLNKPHVTEPDPDDVQ